MAHVRATKEKQMNDTNEMDNITAGNLPKEFMVDNPIDVVKAQPEMAWELIKRQQKLLKVYDDDHKKRWADKSDDEIIADMTEDIDTFISEFKIEYRHWSYYKKEPVLLALKALKKAMLTLAKVSFKLGIV